MTALSICIPTHDGRAGRLTDALESVASQIGGLTAADVEIVVSDNGSRDATQEVVARFADRLPVPVVSRRFEENAGFRRNLLQAVDAAAGRHCWLLGSDDLIAPGGIARVLAVLAEQPELTGITVDQIGVGADLVPDPLDPRGGRDDPAMLPPEGRTLYRDAHEAISELGLLHDFISTQIVHRERWRAAVTRIGEDGLARGRDFPHLPIIIDMIEHDPCWRWLPEPLLVHRMGRETLGAFGKNLSDHALLCITQRHAIWAERLGTRTPLFRSLARRSWARQAGPLAIVHFKSQPDHTARLTLRLLTGLTPRFWFLPGFWLLTLPVLLAPMPLLEVARRAWRPLLRLRGRAAGAGPGAGTAG